MGGLFPSPRYGHVMLKLSESRCLVIGGCAVSPVSEIQGGRELSSGVQILDDSGQANAGGYSLIATDNVDALQVCSIHHSEKLMHLMRNEGSVPSREQFRARRGAPRQSRN